MDNGGMPEPARASASSSGLASSGGDLPAGGFRFWFVGQRWEWSDEVARMHGYEPGTVEPTTELLLSHKHPEDRRHVQELLDHALHYGGSFNSKHRFVDTGGDEHNVIVIADRMYDDSGAVVGTEGYYVDLTETLDVGPPGRPRGRGGGRRTCGDSFSIGMGGHGRGTGPIRAPPAAGSSRP